MATATAVAIAARTLPLRRRKSGVPSTAASTVFIMQLVRTPIAMAAAAAAGALLDRGVVVIETVSASTSVNPSTAPATRIPPAPNVRPTIATANSTIWKITAI